MKKEKVSGVCLPAQSAGRCTVQQSSLYTSIYIKGAVCWFLFLVFFWGAGVSPLFCPNKQRRVCFHDPIKQTDLYHHTISHWLTLFMCGGPCHLLCSFKLFTGDRDKVRVCMIASLISLIFKFWFWISSPKPRGAPLIFFDLFLSPNFS